VVKTNNSLIETLLSSPPPKKLSTSVVVVMIFHHEYRCPYLTNAYSLNIFSIIKYSIYHIYSWWKESYGTAVQESTKLKDKSKVRET